MKRLIFTILTIAIAAGFTFAQGKDEQEIMKIHKALETAFIKNDIATFEAAITDYYTFSGPDGKVQTRVEVLKDARDEIAKPTSKNISQVSDNIKIHVKGDAAYVTADWTGVSQGLGEGTEPHTDKGQYTAIYEKSNGKWMLIREMMTEAQHDRKIMEEGVLKASNAYDEAMLKRDKDAYARLLHKDYTYTTDDGKLVSRDEDVEHFDKMTITSADSRDKKVRIVSNTSAVETGIYHAVGTSSGKPFDETGRYTTTWIWKDLRWQIIADHNSIVKK